MVNNNIFSCGPFSANDAYVWTIVSRLGDMLSKAEDLFGERDKEYTILGVEIANIEQPQIWYPASGKSVIIKITENCIGDMEEAIFQVAHEAVHCLCPNPNKNTTILEEGLATYFSIYYTRANASKNWKCRLKQLYFRSKTNIWKVQYPISPP